MFLTAWRRLDEVPEGDAGRVWLYATARRVLANQRRSSRRREALHERLAAEEASRPADQQPPEEALVHEALRRLPAVDRELLLLAEWEGLSPAQTAAVMGCRRVTARGRLHRARRSGTALVRITHDGELWAGSTIRWNGGDLGVRRDAPQRPGRVGSVSLLVDGTLYGVEEGRWVNLGSPANIDPDSGTTPAETLAAVRDDVGGGTLRRLAGGVNGFTATRGAGATVYRGKVAAGLVARETGFKEGEAIRVFPFGYVAHDEAADPAALLDAALTVGSNGVVREIALSWGTWTYTVSYTRLGSTAALAAPKNAHDLVKERLRAVGRS